MWVTRAWPWAPAASTPVRAKSSRACASTAVSTAAGAGSLSSASGTGRREAQNTGRACNIRLCAALIEPGPSRSATSRLSAAGAIEGVVRLPM